MVEHVPKQNWEKLSLHLEAESASFPANGADVRLRVFCG